MQLHHLTAKEWDALEADPEFQALLRARRRFIVPATIFFMLYYLALPFGVAFDPSLMSAPAIGSMTVAFAYGFSQFVMAWVLLVAYVFVAKNFDERAERIATKARAEYAR